MDQKPDIPDIKPDIKPDVNREEKKPGIWAGLLARWGLASPVSTGGIFAGARVGAGIGGGLLATKAGIIGLILAGATVAGSIGVVGYKLFGPSSSDRADADFTAIFQPKPKDEASSGGEDKARADGVSSSLEALIKANAKTNANETLSSQSKSGQETASASKTPPMKNDNAPSQGPAAKLQMKKKFGDLSTGIGLGGFGSSAFSTKSGASTLLAGAQGVGTGAGGGASKLMGNQRKANDAWSQLNQGYRDYHSGTLPDYGKGRIYTGANVPNADIGTAQGLGGSPAGQDTGAPSANTPVNPTNINNRFPPPAPTPPGSNVTPWQTAMNDAYMLVIAALALLYFASTLGGKNTKLTSKTQLQMAVIALAAVAAICGGIVIMLGNMISTGSFGQPLQGGILTAAGGCIIAAATAEIIGASSFVDEHSSLAGIWSGLMYICGAVAALGVVISYMTPAHSYISGTFANDKPPDLGQGYVPGPNQYKGS